MAIQETGQNIPGYIVLTREVLYLHPDEELIRRMSKRDSLVKAAFDRQPAQRLRLVGLNSPRRRPKPRSLPTLDEVLSRNQLYGPQLYGIELHLNRGKMRSRLDELDRNPDQALPLVEFAQNGLRSLKEIERTILTLHFALEIPGAQVRTWEEVATEMGRKSSPRERGESAIKTLRGTRPFLKDIPEFLSH